MPNLAAVSLMVSDKIFKDFKNLNFVANWQPEFLKESNSFKNSEEDHGRNISVKFHQNLTRCLKKNLTHGPTHDGQWP